MRKNNKVNVYETLKTKIQFLKLKPGSPINDGDLADELNISRTPIREALIRLSNEQLVDIYPQSGTYVSKINLSLIKEIEHMRHIVETEICLNMCRKNADVTDMVSESLFLMDRAIKNQDIERFIFSDDKFHLGLFSYEKHEIMWNIISNNRTHYNRFLMLDLAFPNALSESYEDHIKIVEYINKGEAEKLISLLETHHDYNYLQREDQIKQKCGEYFL